jgi:L-histidine Nalpha-methyltransferase
VGTVDVVTLLADDGASPLADDVRRGLTASRKWLPPKYLYDARGSALFEDITRLPEYYQTRTETQILAAVVDDVLAEVRPEELIELGSGASRKTRLLIEAMGASGCGDRYVPFDVSGDALGDAIDALHADYPWLRIQGVVGDFDHHLGAIPREGRGLVAFLGGTIGNLHPQEQPGFLNAVTSTFRSGDALLLGVDLQPGPMKDVATLEAAYDDAAGVTAAFNRNVLHVLNRELGADFPVGAFSHVARYVEEEGWVELALRAEEALTVALPALDLTVRFSPGEELRTEISCKFTAQGVDALFTAAGLTLRRFDTDPRARFALALGTWEG